MCTLTADGSYTTRTMHPGFRFSSVATRDVAVLPVSSADQERLLVKHAASVLWTGLPRLLIFHLIRVNRLSGTSTRSGSDLQTNDSLRGKNTHVCLTIQDRGTDDQRAGYTTGRLPVSFPRETAFRGSGKISILIPILSLKWLIRAAFISQHSPSACLCVCRRVCTRAYACVCALSSRSIS